MTTSDPRTIAERLGLPEDVVRALQRRGVLRKFDLDDAEIRERLWRGHLRSDLPSQSPRPSEAEKPAAPRKRSRSFSRA